MNRWRALALAGLMLSPGCDKALTGGALIPSNRLPAGVLVATYVPVACSDGSDRISRRVFDHMRDARGVSWLVERSSSSDWVVITNSFIDGPTVVFQAIQESSQPRVVWEYRLPIDAVGSGTFRASGAFSLEAQPGGPFRAALSDELNRCTMQRVSSNAPLEAAPSAAAGDARPPATPPLAAGVTEPKSWGYDGRTFVAGDRVLVEAGGRAVAGTVVRGDGEQYLVHHDGQKPEAGEWVRPWQIIGRVRPVAPADSTRAGDGGTPP